MKTRFAILAAALALSAAAFPAASQSIDEMTLSAAARECRPAEVSAMTQKGVDVNSTNSGGYTPLMLAAGEGCAEAVRLLLEAGADATISHASFGDAAAQAKMHRQARTLALLEAAAAGPAAAPTPTAPPAAPGPAPEIAAPEAAPEQVGPVAAQGGGATAWPQLGAYGVGQTVLWSGTAGKTWQRDVVKALDPTYGYSFVGGPSGSYDRFRVVAPQREPFWTGWFVGDWRVSVPMAMGLVTDGRNLYRTVSGGLRLPPLRINADGTYSWRVQEGSGEKLINGRWEPNPQGPGVILKNAEKGADWLVYNNTDAQSALGETVILASDCCTHYDGSRID